MRKIIYYYSGTVTNFEIEETHYKDFARNLKEDRRNSDRELNRARGVLGAYVCRETGEGPGPLERIAACYVWNYFNTHTAADHCIKGDVMIVDLDGTGTTIEYVAAVDVQLKPL